MSEKYSEAQVQDIREREKKALEMLKELQLTPAVSMQWHNTGNDVFGVHPVPFLQDLKFTAQASPIQP